MELTWYGLSCFRITERKHATIVMDPYGAGFGLPELKLRADVVTTSHNAKGHSHLKAVTGARHTLRGPGEYEIGNVFITAIATADDVDSRQNAIYLFDYDGLTVAHLGDMQKVPKQTEIDALEEVNILLVPVGGGSSLNAAQASEVVSMLEPNIVVPMHYKHGDLALDLETLDRFLKEMGVADVAEDSSLKVGAGNLPEETQIVLLVPTM